MRSVRKQSVQRALGVCMACKTQAACAVMGGQCRCAVRASSTSIGCPGPACEM